MPKRQFEYSKISKKKIFNPLSPPMLDLLMDCHERELMGMEPVSFLQQPSLSGLIDRGMVQPKEYVTISGKKMMGFFTTPYGRALLSTL